MKALQVTLYDIFGYLVPGAITLAALTILYWSAFESIPFQIKSISALEWTILAVVSYLFGHLIQAIANHLVKFWPSTVKLVLKDGEACSLSKVLLDRAIARSQEILGLPKDSVLSSSEVWDACDHFTMQKCKTDTRDVYVYREGFYRGIFVSMALLGISLIVRAFTKSSAVKLGDVMLVFNSLQMVVFGTFCFISSLLAFVRYRRFGVYLVKFSVFSAIVTVEAKEKTQGA